MSQKKLEDNSGGGITYAQAFMQIGKELKVSPYFLASRIRQEQGVKGDSPLISGNYPGYKGYYNYFNISATGLGEQVVINGLKEAKAAGWTMRHCLAEQKRRQRDIFPEDRIRSICRNLMWMLPMMDCTGISICRIFWRLTTKVKMSEEVMSLWAPSTINLCLKFQFIRICQPPLIQNPEKS